MSIMNTIRLTVTADLKKEIDYLRMMEYPTLTDAEIVKVTVGAQAVKSRRAKYDDSDPSMKAMKANTARVWGLDEEDEEELFWDESKLKPVKF
ncbi:MAG: hypothetical protein UU93_C0007G0043 [Candidatus Amesbacteria bacterium GW2011_GWA2_42_12]|uniref:Uncharacterized protein n=1 Tax=Candidatus Amesbacteria bacterium GW2011_GWA2_42_12 TaxID=1618356 RepID=A0A0G1B4G5_9BACT|nr:MAG: hypothetical protein UU93_C0007G0043 [Candidatus Amesbacteria bacterium GW2011_GWA2_42_12]